MAIIEREQVGPAIMAGLKAMGLNRLTLDHCQTHRIPEGAASDDPRIVLLRELVDDPLRGGAWWQTPHGRLYAIDGPGGFVAIPDEYAELRPS